MDFQIIQPGKATVIARFIEAMVVLFLLSTRLPSAVNLAGKTISLLSGHMRNPLSIFVVCNAIILVVVLISRQNPSANGWPEEEKEKMVVVEEEGEGVFNLNTESGDENMNNLKQEDQRVISVIDLNSEPEVQHGMTRHQFKRSKTDINKNNIKGAEERVISENLMDLSQEVQSVMPHHQLRRSKTDIKKNKNVGERAISVFKGVDTLSNEEFQRTIDAFIAKQQKFLWAQKVAEMK